MTTRSRWSSIEDDMLRKGYGVVDMELLSKMLGRSIDALRFRAHQLGIKAALPVRKRVGLTDLNSDNPVADAYKRGYQEGQAASQAVAVDAPEWEPVELPYTERMRLCFGEILMTLDMKLEHGPYAVCRRKRPPA